MINSVHLQDVGGGTPLVLLHGGGVSGWMWRPLIEQLSPDQRIIVPDLPGHGQSADRAYVSHEETVRELAAVITSRAAAGADLAGFSLGGQLAILLAAQHPHLVRSVTVISAETEPAPFPGLVLWLVGATTPLAKMERFARAQARQLKIPAVLLPDYLRDSAALTRETLVASTSENIRFTPPTGWTTYPGPATVLVGERESSIMIESARRTSALRPGTLLRVVDGAGHDLPLTRPELLAAVIRETSGRAGPGARSSG